MVSFPHPVGCIQIVFRYEFPKPVNVGVCLGMQNIEQFRNYCDLIKIARCGFPGKKTTKRAFAFPNFLRAALAEGNDVRLSLGKAACSSMAPPSSTGNPASVYTNCETALAAHARLLRRASLFSRKRANASSPSMGCSLPLLMSS